jgi:hypothetical protein
VRDFASIREAFGQGREALVTGARCCGEL